ncbi:MAG: hypothetical protein ACP5RE_04240, partial [Candidatus Acidifodinimicrobium sp.]
FPDVIGALYIPEEMPVQSPVERDAIEKKEEKTGVNNNEQTPLMNISEEEAKLLKYVEYNEGMDEYRLTNFLGNGEFDSLRKLMGKLGYEYDRNKKSFRKGHYDPVSREFILEGAKA